MTTNKHIAGKIKYFNLETWWTQDLTNLERNMILEKKPSIIDGNISNSSQTVLSFLSNLSGWFMKIDERNIGHKLIRKAESLIQDNSAILDLHFLYDQKINLLYKDRNNITNGLEQTIKACLQQIKISKQVVPSLLKKYNGDSLPSHKGYKQLAIILEKQKKFDGAIKLSKDAQKNGWAGDWNKRIERCKSKKN